MNRFCYGLFFLLTILASVCSAAIIRVRRDTALDSEEKPTCYSREPCMFVMLQRQTDSNAFFAYRKIPSWCKCDVNSVCAPSRYDKRKRANVHTCQIKDTVELSRRDRYWDLWK